MEKVKFKEGAVYDLAVNGVYFNDESATLTFCLPEGKTYDQVETDVTNCAKIEILDSDGGTMDARTGYIYLDSLTKKKDYVIKYEPVEGVDDEPQYKDVTATVMIAVLKRSDMRQEINDIKETVDMLVLDSLGV